MVTTSLTVSCGVASSKPSHAFGGCELADTLLVAAGKLSAAVVVDKRALRRPDLVEIDEPQVPGPLALVEQMR